MVTKDQAQILRDSLKALDKRDGLSVLAMVAGVPKARLKEIIKGETPTDFEYMTLDTLRGM